jgi:DNA-binding XRE family transcriptional regulator
MTFGSRLKKAREGKKLNQETLGQLLDGVSKQTISHWEGGRYEPNINQLSRLCALLGVSADHLLRGAPTSWPFSEELRYAVAQLDGVGLVKLENIVRATFGMDPLQRAEQLPNPIVRTNSAIDPDQGISATSVKSLTDEQESIPQTGAARKAGARSLSSVPERAPVWPDDKSLLGPMTAPPTEDGKHGARSKNRTAKRK